MTRKKPTEKEILGLMDSFYEALEGGDELEQRRTLQRLITADPESAETYQTDLDIILARKRGDDVEADRLQSMKDESLAALEAVVLSPIMQVIDAYTSAEFFAGVAREAITKKYDDDEGIVNASFRCDDDVVYMHFGDESALNRLASALENLTLAVAYTVKRVPQEYRVTENGGMAPSLEKARQTLEDALVSAGRSALDNEARVDSPSSLTDERLHSFFAETVREIEQTARTAIREQDKITRLGR